MKNYSREFYRVVICFAVLSIFFLPVKNGGAFLTPQFNLQIPFTSNIESSLSVSSVIPVEPPVEPQPPATLPTTPSKPEVSIGEEFIELNTSIDLTNTNYIIVDFWPSKMIPDYIRYDNRAFQKIELPEAGEERRFEGYSLSGTIKVSEDGGVTLLIEKTSGGIKKGLPYQVHLRAVGNEIVELSEWSQLSEEFTIWDDEGDLPESLNNPPVISHRVTTINEKIQIRWDEIEGAKWYKLRIIDSNTGRQVGNEVILSSDRFFEKELFWFGITEPGEYKIQVKGVNEVGESQEWSPLSDILSVNAVEKEPYTAERIFDEFGIIIENGDIEGINLMYKAMEENYQEYEPYWFYSKSIIYPSDIIPNKYLKTIYQILKSFPQKFLDGLEGEKIKVYAKPLPVAEKDYPTVIFRIGGATYVEEPQLREGIYMFTSSKGVFYHEFSHVFYKTVLTEPEREKFREIFWHGETDLDTVLSNPDDFIGLNFASTYGDKPNVEEIIMEDWASTAGGYFCNSESIIELARLLTVEGSTPIELESGEISSVIKEKVKFVGNLFKHEVNGKEMTYIYKIEAGEILIAEVPFAEDGLPDITEPIDWKPVIGE